MAHLFRTGNFRTNGESSFPYPLSQRAIDKARKYSQDYWKHGKWPKQEHKLSWLLDKFWPVPGWTEEQLQEQRNLEQG